MKTAKVTYRGVRHAIPADREPWGTICGYVAAISPAQDGEVTCKWCRDRLGLDREGASDER